jgi:hypothetical protein
MAEAISNIQPDGNKFVLIEWPEPDIAIYANNLLATNDGSALYMTFCQIQPPILIGSEEEQKKRLAEITNVKARPVARIVAPVHLIPEIIKVLQGQLSAIEGLKQAHDSTTTT